MLSKTLSCELQFWRQPAAAWCKMLEVVLQLCALPEGLPSSTSEVDCAVQRLGSVFPLTVLGSWKRPFEWMHWLSLGDNQSDGEHVLTRLQFTTDEFLAGSLCTLGVQKGNLHMAAVVIYSYKNIQPRNIITTTL